MARIVVTGAAGFVGRALTHALSAAGHEVIGLTRSNGDVTEAALWAALPAAEHVFHLAGRSYVPESWRDPGGFLNINVGGTARALDYCRAHNAHLVFVSAYIYGHPKRLPIHEDDEAEPNNPYALSKFLAERACAFYAESFGLPVTVIRPFNIFGSGQRPEFLIPTILNQVRQGGTIRVKDLTPRRDYVLLDDVAAALVCALKNPGPYRVFNIGSGVSCSVQEVIDIIQAAAGTKLPVASEGDMRPHEISDIRADISRARSVLGWEPRFSFAEGIGRLLRADLRDMANGASPPNRRAGHSA